MARIVFDIGATNTRVARIEGKVLGEISRKPTPKERGDWGAHLLEMVAEAFNGEEAEEIVGGVASIEGRKMVAAAFPNARVYNDAALAGLGEAVFGAGKGKEVVGFIGLGTGIGTARIEGKKINPKGFEAGHHIIDFSNNGTWEGQVSGQAILREHGKLLQELPREIYDDYVGKIAIGVYNAILFWSPDIVVLGGGLMDGKDGFKAEEIARKVGEINKALDALPEIKLGELGDEAGLHGALFLMD